MIDDETKYSVEEVVEICKTAPIYIVNREKTRQFWLKINKSIEDLKVEIRTLRPEYSCAEPEKDYDETRRGYVYQFKKWAFGQYWCYIKVKVKQRKIVVVISFHEEDINYEK